MHDTFSLLGLFFHTGTLCFQCRIPSGDPFCKLSAKIASFKFYRGSFRRYGRRWLISQLTEMVTTDTTGQANTIPRGSRWQLSPGTNIIFPWILLRWFHHSLRIDCKTATCNSCRYYRHNNNGCTMPHQISDRRDQTSAINPDRNGIEIKFWCPEATVRVVMRCEFQR